ncbi:MAG: hypothetical protein HQ580_00930 [Planctomycetes bacterium]|nr:hypothetical protein [Planctomycetota bacterium]
MINQTINLQVIQGISTIHNMQKEPADSRLLFWLITYVFSLAIWFVVLVVSIGTGSELGIRTIVGPIFIGALTTWPFLFPPSRYFSSIAAMLAWLIFVTGCHAAPSVFQCYDWGHLQVYSFSFFIWLVIWGVYYFRQRIVHERWRDGVVFGLLLSLMAPAYMFVWFFNMILVPANIIPPLHVLWLIICARTSKKSNMPAHEALMHEEGAE